MNKSRYLKKQIASDLSEKMVFLGGPRQVGKPTLAKQFIQTPDQYLNWEKDSDRKLILKDRVLPFTTFCKELELP